MDGPRSLVSASGLPIQILLDLSARGVHVDCLVAGVGKTCDRCQDQIDASLFAHYGHHSTSERFLDAVLSDVFPEGEM